MVKLPKRSCCALFARFSLERNCARGGKTRQNQGARADFDRKSRSTFARFSLVALALACGPSALAEELTTRLPAYRPKIGVERVYRVEIETSADSHGLTRVGERSVRGEFTNALTVLEPTLSGFKMRWRLTPKEPPPGQAGLTEIFRDRIQAFGADTIEVETDPRGAAKKIDNLDAMRKAVETRIEGLKSDDPSKERLQSLLPRLQPGSLFPMDVIAPAARLFAEAQTPEEREADLGMPQTANAEGHSNGASVPIKLTTRYDKDEAHGFITFTSTKVFDSKALTEAWREVIERETKELAAKRPEASAEKLAEYSRASLTITTTVRLSLDDGSAIYAEEIVDNRIGPAFTRNVLRATRE